MKVCPFCAEIIKAAAKKCPHCNSALVKYALFRQELILGLVCLLSLGFFGFICVQVWPVGSDESGRSFAWHGGELEAKVLQVDLNNEATNQIYYNVSGVVTNQGKHSWRVESIELALTNTAGVVDVLHESLEPFVIQSRSEHAFVFKSRTILTNPVTATQARVDNAKDGNQPEKSPWSGDQ